MAANAELIKEFLVGLGFKIDEKGQKRFVDTIGAATVQAAALGAAATAAATAVVAAVAKISDGLEQLYFASQRSKASVEAIQALDFAARQFGAGAREAVESLGRFLRSSPGAESFLQNLGVQTRGANGQLRDTGEILTGLGERLRQMPYYRAKAYADFLGIDERTLQALQQGLGQFSAQYRDMLRAANLDADKAAKASHGFMVELRTLGAAFDVLAKKTGSELAGGLSDEIRRFRQWIVSNFETITDAIVKVVKFLVKVGDIIVTLARRGGEAIGAIIDWFHGLNSETQDLLKTIGLIAVAWKALNLTITMSPVGRILALVGALTLLFDDFQVWKEGGKSLIDWGKWSAEIDKAVDGIDRLAKAVEDLWSRIKPAWDKISPLLDMMGKDQARSQAAGASAIVDLLTGNWDKKVDDGQATTALESPILKAMTGKYPRGIRNNNPGNLNYVGQPGATLEDGPNARFAKFKTTQDGLQALANQLRLYGARGVDTIRELVTTYAPASENDTRSYINQLAQFMGIDPDEKFDVRTDPTALAMLMKGIIKHENGYNPYTPEQINAAAGVPQVAASAPQIHQKTDIHVHGVTDPQAAGQAVAREQTVVNDRMLRNLRGAVQ
ncbi:hypothetical protein CAL14_08525 [Bordetella genomosp. 9]|uniref:hypothetical protein n=1 Tax=Bordetella genomosp. 9 TaxID=1416803 RepID=UPI000A28F77B|nr:hypothetical protein [Bordetella genomosp. 9]ARP90326.1 hypothetical protein CAL14_08525 [Bordetella genomosp. 9]